MENISFITDSKGFKTGIVINFNEFVSNISTFDDDFLNSLKSELYSYLTKKSESEKIIAYDIAGKAFSRKDFSEKIIDLSKTAKNGEAKTLNSSELETVLFSK